jgi:TM2 domain-containing membrane protein YozV
VAFVPATTKGTIMSAIVLWIIALVVGIIGIVQLLQGQIILGVVLIIAAFLIGPGGYSIFRSRSHA